MTELGVGTSILIISLTATSDIFIVFLLLNYLLRTFVLKYRTTNVPAMIIRQPAIVNWHNMETTLQSDNTRRYSGPMTSRCAQLCACCVPHGPSCSYHLVETRLSGVAAHQSSPDSQRSAIIGVHQRPIKPYTERYALLVMEHLIRLYAFGASFYVVVASSELFADVTISEDGHQPDSPLFVLLAVHTGSVVSRLLLNVALHRRLRRSPAVCLLLLVVYDVILTLTLGIIIFGRMLDVLGAAILFAECAPLLSHWERKEERMGDINDTEANGSEGSQLVGSPTSAAAEVQLNSVANNNNDMLEFDGTADEDIYTSIINKFKELWSKLLACCQRCMTTVSRQGHHLQTTMDVILMCLFRLLLPALLLGTFIIQEGIYSLTQLPLCVLSFSITFFCVLHLCAIGLNVHLCCRQRL